MIVCAKGDMLMYSRPDIEVSLELHRVMPRRKCGYDIANYMVHIEAFAEETYLPVLTSGCKLALDPSSFSADLCALWPLS